MSERNTVHASVERPGVQRPHECCDAWRKSQESQSARRGAIVIAPRWTPGPWLIGMNNAHAGGIATVYHCTGGYAEIWSEKWVEVGNGPEVHDANARLIAAAPELYQALAAMVAAAEFEDWDGRSKDYEVAVAALAKARGES